MDIGTDLNKQTHYEQSGEQKEAQDTINNVLEKEKQRKKRIVKLIKEDLLNSGGTIEATNNSYFGILENVGLQIYKELDGGNLFKYSKENGVEFINSIPGLEEHQFLYFGEQESGYKLKKGKLYKDGKEIPQILPNGNVNPEYIKGISDLIFYVELQDTFGIIKAILNNKKVEIESGAIKQSIISGVSRIKEVLFFRQHGYIPNDKDFQELLIRAIQELPNQSADTRFYENAKGERMGMEVTKQELDEYLHPTEGDPLITQEMYNQCIKLIEKRDELIKKKKETKEKTKLELEIEKTKKGVLDRIKDLLGW